MQPPSSLLPDITRPKFATFRQSRERVYRAETVIVLVGLRIYFSSEICYEIIIMKIADVL